MNEHLKRERVQEEPSFTIVEFNPQHASLSQQADILALHQALRHENACSSYEELCKKDLEGCRLFVAKNDTTDSIHAMILLGEKDGEYWIYHNVVSVDVVGQGLGKRMLETAIAAAKRAGAGSIFLHCKPIQERDAARAIYQSFGFNNLGQDIDEPQRVDKFVLNLT